MASPATTKKSTAKKRTAPKKNESTQRKWKRAKAEEVTVPSGNLALIKRPGMEVFLFEGLLPDALQPLVQEAIKTGRGLPQTKIKAMAESEEAIKDMMNTIDRVTARIMVEPKVIWHRRPVSSDDGSPVMETYKDADGKDQKRQVLEDVPENERVDVEGVLYTDDIDFEDKSFLFQYAVGGTRDLERFRGESNEAVESVRDGDDVSEPTE